MSGVLWEKAYHPLGFNKRKKYRIIGIMNTHIKYCPSNNTDEVHIIRRDDFIKGFKQVAKD